MSGTMTITINFERKAWRHIYAYQNGFEGRDTEGSVIKDKSDRQASKGYVRERLLLWNPLFPIRGDQGVLHHILFRPNICTSNFSCIPIRLNQFPLLSLKSCTTVLPKHQQIACALMYPYKRPARLHLQYAFNRSQGQLRRKSLLWKLTYVIGSASVFCAN